MVTFLMILLGVVTVLLGLVILIQEPKQAGLSGAFGLGGETQMLGTSATSGIARFTMYLSVAFFVLCITVGLMAREERDDSRLKSDPIENSVGALVPGGVGIGDAIGGDERVTIVDPVTGEGIVGVRITGDDAADDGAVDDAATDDDAADDGVGDANSSGTSTDDGGSGN
jgi:preprotein translocase subunit SecG